MQMQHDPRSENTMIGIPRPLCMCYTILSHSCTHRQPHWMRFERAACRLVSGADERCAHVCHSPCVGSGLLRIVRERGVSLVHPPPAITLPHRSLPHAHMRNSTITSACARMWQGTHAYICIAISICPTRVLALRAQRGHEGAPGAHAACGGGRGVAAAAVATAVAGVGADKRMAEDASFM